MKQGRAPATDKTNRFTKATVRFTKDLVLMREQGGALSAGISESCCYVCAMRSMLCCMIVHATLHDGG